MPGRSGEELTRSRLAGKRWEHDCVRYLNEHGWPGAAVEMRTGRNDLIGTWDLAVECTITSWDKLWIKLGQAMADAQARGLRDFCVWKKRNGSADPDAGAVIMRAREFFPLVMRLERLERLEVEAAEAYDRGYRNGQAAARQEVGA